MIIQKSISNSKVKIFSNKCPKMEQIPIVDAEFSYECPYKIKTYLIIVRNMLNVNSIPHNLVLPFIIMEAVIKVNNMSIINYVEDVNHECH